MSIKDKIAQYAEEQVQTRMGPAVEQMEKLEKQLIELNQNVKELTKVMKEKK